MIEQKTRSIERKARSIQQFANPTNCGEGEGVVDSRLKRRE